MDSIVRICAIGLFALSLILGLIAAAPDQALLEFDPVRPATLGPVISAGAQGVLTPVFEWVNTTLTHLHDVLQRTRLREALPR